MSGQWQGTATAGNTSLVISTAGSLIIDAPMIGTPVDGSFPPVIINLSEGITLGSDGITIEENGPTEPMQIELFVILK